MNKEQNTSYYTVVVVVQSLSRVQLFAIPWTAACRCPSPSPGVCSNSCPLSQWCHPTISSSVALFSCSQSFPASRYFPMSKFIVIRWPKYWSFSFSISPSSKYSGLISFRIDWFDLLVVQGTLESSPAPQFKSINYTNITWCVLFLYTILLQFPSE